MSILTKRFPYISARLARCLDRRKEHNDRTQWANSVNEFRRPCVRVCSELLNYSSLSKRPKRLQFEFMCVTFNGAQQLADRHAGKLANLRQTQSDSPWIAFAGGSRLRISFEHLVWASGSSISLSGLHAIAKSIGCWITRIRRDEWHKLAMPLAMPFIAQAERVFAQSPD